MEDNVFVPIIIALCASGGVAVSIIGGIREYLVYKREKRLKKIDEVLARLDVIEQTQSTQKEALKFLLYDRISYLGQRYVYDKQIGYDDRRILNSMHSVYHSGLNGNGDLDVLMREVNMLPLKNKKNKE